MGHTRMTTQGNAQFNQNNHPFLGHVDGSSFALAHNGVLWNDKELRMEENLPLTSVETDSYVAVQLLSSRKPSTLTACNPWLKQVEGSFVFTVLDKDNSIWFAVGDNPLCVMFYDGFLIYASTQEILCKTIKKLKLNTPTDILEPKEGEILKIDRTGRITTGISHRTRRSSIGGENILSTAAITRTRRPVMTICSAWRRHSALPLMKCRHS